MVGYEKIRYSLRAQHIPIFCVWLWNYLSVCQYYPLEEILAAEYLLEEFRPDLIEMVLDKLRPENVRWAHIQGLLSVLCA